MKLDGFGDASEKSIAAVVYLRVLTVEKVIVSLVATKAFIKI